MVRSVVLAVLFSPLAAAFACTPQGATELVLERSPAEYAGAASAQRVAVYANGCLLIERPAYFIEPGRFSRALSTATLANLRAQVASLHAKRDLQSVLNGELERARQAKALAGEVMVVNDADMLRLTFGEGDAAASLQLAGMLQKAEALPDAAVLNAVALLVHELLREAERPGRHPLAADAAGAGQ